MTLPPPADPCRDAALFTCTQGDTWLCYEVARDFLSTPRCFAIVRADTQAGWCYSHQPATEAAAEEGFYHWSDAEGLHCVQLSLGDAWISLGASTISLVAQVYQAAGAQAALRQCWQAQAQ
jgi:hypothetical protein